MYFVRNEELTMVEPKRFETIEAATRQGLYDPRNEHDACGVGFVANLKGEASHSIIEEIGRAHV